MYHTLRGHKYEGYPGYIYFIIVYLKVTILSKQTNHKANISYICVLSPLKQLKIFSDLMKSLLNYRYYTCIPRHISG
jgi:hypothetical protein